MSNFISAIGREWGIGRMANLEIGPSVPGTNNAYSVTFTN